jgi:hypothetical protein
MLAIPEVVTTQGAVASSAVNRSVRSSVTTAPREERSVTADVGDATEKELTVGSVSDVAELDVIIVGVATPANVRLKMARITVAIRVPIFINVGK